MAKKKLIEVKSLFYKYPDGTQALEDISFDVFEGESVGIVGPNGAGKSTLLLHLNGILQGEGHITVSGLDMKEANLPLIRQKVGLVFQDPDSQLFMPTVHEDVAFGPINMNMSPPEVKSSVRLALQKVEMEDFLHRSSHHLSLGEKRKISLATVLSMDPDILILDEPSSNLDPRSRRELIKLLKTNNHTKIFASHDLEMILEVCQRVILLDAGKIIAEGDPIEVLSNKVLMTAHGLEVPISIARKENSLKFEGV